MSGWQSIESAPKDGTWILLRGRNSLNYPMIPVVCAWRRGERGDMNWRDSAVGYSMGHLVHDVPLGGAADWHALPGSAADAIERMVNALTLCRDQFADYERQHRAKGTPEADAKAQVNAGMVAMIEDALNPEKSA